MPHDHDLGIVSVDNSAGGDGDMPGLSQPIAQADIEDVLHDTYHPVNKRIEMLMDLKGELQERRNVDRGEEFDSMILEIDAALDELSGNRTMDAAASGIGLDPADRNDMSHDLDDPEGD